MPKLHFLFSFVLPCLVSLSAANAFIVFPSNNAQPKQPTTLSVSSLKEEADHKFTRTAFLQSVALVLTAPRMAKAFEGGVGGLGKTKPETGVLLFEESSTPIQNQQGFVSAEIKSINGKPILVEFKSPWPLLPTTSGLETRDLRSSESAFVQVVEAVPNYESPKVFKEVLIDSVLALKGKFGAYGTPVDIKVKPLSSERKDIFSVTFTSYTPAMRESERQLWINPKKVDNTLVLLIVGTTRARFSSQEKEFSKVIDSFEAVLAPESKLRAR